MKLNPALYSIVRFKGVRPLARALNVDQAMVHRWKKNGLIPSKYHVDLLAKAKEMELAKFTPVEIVYGGEVPDSVIKKSFTWILHQK